MSLGLSQRVCFQRREMTLDISWVDDFVDNIKPYVFVRERDNLLILVPNQAYKLNPSGLKILKSTLDGTPVEEVLKRICGGNVTDDVLQDTHDFFCDIRAMMVGCIGEGKNRRAVETKPFTRPHNELPVLSEIALTYNCNLACRFCYAGCSCKKDNGAQEMTTDEVKTVIDRIRDEAEVPSVSWTGGEPTLRSDIHKLTRYATDKGMRVNLITNATLLNETLVGQLVDSGLKSAQVSLEGPDANIHDALTQLEGSFNRTLNGLSLLRKAGITAHTNTTVNRENIEHLTGIVDLIASLGLTRFSMNMVIPCGNAHGPDVTISYTEMAEHIDKVKLHARKLGVEFMWYSPTPYCIYNPIASRLGGKSCAACDGLLSVAPNGDVLPCSSLPESVGNLVRQTFDDVWGGKRATFWREKKYAHSICRDCELFDVCTGACPIYWDSMGYEELEEVKSEVCKV